MSLFEVREFWSSNSSLNEEFSDRSMVLYPPDIVITGSFEGILRAFKPQRGEFKIEDLLLETPLEPIMQIEVGSFSQFGDSAELAILHPRKFCVYKLVEEAGNYSLELIYKNNLGRNSFNFTFGPFGDYTQQGKNLICIQSSDGAFGIFDQGQEVFSVQLPGFLAPGPMTYNPSNDSFIICNATMEIECYRFNALRDSVNRYQSGQDATFKPEWKVNIGEYVQNIICSVNRVMTDYDIMILGERSIFGMQDNGTIRIQERLEYGPSCLTTFAAGQSPVTLIGSFTNHLLMYKKNELVWASRTPELPISLKVAEFAGTKGLVVALNDNGSLTVSYLGTSPPNHSFLSPSRNADYEAMNQEYIRLLQKIESSGSDEMAPPAEAVAITASVQGLPQYQSLFHESNEFVGEGGRVLATQASIQIRAYETINNVQISVQCPPALHCRESPISLDSIYTGSNDSQTITILSKSAVVPTSLSVKILVSFSINVGERQDYRTATTTLRVPFSQVAEAVPPIQEANYKITLTAVTPTPIDQLISEMQSDFPGGNAASYLYFNKSYCTIISNSTGDKYRVQGSHLEAIWLVVEQLYVKTKGQLRYEEVIPLQDMYSVIDNHHAARKRVIELENELSDLCQQLTAIEKRLLVRFKDRNPAPLNNLDNLLFSTQTQIVNKAEEIQAIQGSVTELGYRLSGSLNLILILVKMRCGLDEKNFEIFKQYLSPEVTEQEQGWEEITNAAMIQLLRTKLAKSSRESAAVTGNLEFQGKTDKLKKHISIVCERLGTGARIVN